MGGYGGDYEWVRRAFKLRLPALSSEEISVNALSLTGNLTHSELSLTHRVNAFEYRLEIGDEDALYPRVGGQAFKVASSESQSPLRARSGQ